MTNQNVILLGAPPGPAPDFTFQKRRYMIVCRFNLLDYVEFFPNQTVGIRIHDNFFSKKTFFQNLFMEKKVLNNFSH